MSLGDLLRLIRTRHGLNQTQMGDLFYRNKDYVYMIENGKTLPSVKELNIISDKLDEPVLKLVMYGLSVSQAINIERS